MKGISVSRLPDRKIPPVQSAKAVFFIKKGEELGNSLKNYA